MKRKLFIIAAVLGLSGTFYACEQEDISNDIKMEVPTPPSPADPDEPEPGNDDPNG